MSLRTPILLAVIWYLAACPIGGHRDAPPAWTALVRAVTAAPSLSLATADVAALASAVQSDADRSEHESGAQRSVTVERARTNAAACIAQAPEAAACQYVQGLALGLAAREHPLHALGYLKNMLASLARAEAIDPDYDAAGPARVRALVLARAPGWPLGPGDMRLALEAASRAVDRHPEYPPNWLALAEAQQKSGARQLAGASYARARTAALAWGDEEERRSWLQQVDAALGGHRAP